MLTLPNPPVAYDMAWMNQYTRTLELENERLRSFVRNIPVGGGTNLTGNTHNYGLLYNLNNVLTNLATANNGVLVTNGSGIPSISTTVPAGVSVTNTTVLSTGSTTSRALGIRFSETIDVKDFGAVGDNATDDTAAIQAAINALIALGGGVLYFPPGIYVVSATLTVTVGQIYLVGCAPAWFGQTQGATIRMTTANTDILKIAGADAAHQINNNGVINLTLGHGITSMDDTNTSGSGIKLANTVRTVIDNCVIYGMGRGISCNFVVNLDVSRARINRIFAVPAGNSYGIYLEDDGIHANASNTFRDLTIATYRPGTVGTFYGVYYNGAILNDQFFENVEVDAADYGFYLKLTAPSLKADIKIDKCVVDGYTTRGIYLEGFNTYGGVDIIGGWIAPAAGLAGAVYGVHGNNCSGIKVLGVEFVGISNVANTAGYAIYFNGCPGAIVVGNRFRDYYIHIGADTLAASTLTGNSFKQTGGTAAGDFVILNTNSTDNTIAGNAFDAGSGAAVGILVNDAGSVRNSIVGNSFAGTFSTTKIQDNSPGATNGLRTEGTATGAGAGAGTLTNAPSAGNPAYWHPIVIGGTTRYFPCW